MISDNNDRREKIIGIVRLKGPLLPVDIAKQIGTDILFASALLSELVSSGRIKMTTVKIGGSPLYYMENQSYKIESLMRYLNEKDMKTASLLKKEKVLRDIALSPLERVSLRQIKDFAKPIRVNMDNNVSELFWMWYNSNEEECKNKIRGILEFKPLIEAQKVAQISQEEVKIQVPIEKIEQVIVEKPVEIKQPLTKKEIVHEKVLVERKATKIKHVEKGVKQKKIEFYDAIKEYFEENNIKVVKETIVKKNKEFNYIIKVGSDLGELDFFVKAIDKKKISDGDLSLALNESKGHPLIFLSIGDLNKKAEKQMNEGFKGVLFRNIAKQ